MACVLDEHHIYSHLRLNSRFLTDHKFILPHPLASVPPPVPESGLDSAVLVAPDAFRTRLLDWFDRARRDLPWRRPPGDLTSPLDPYAVLVSEAMLQQTQVATVIPYFNRWMTRFPNVRSLADADEQEVLRHWAGLGYYNRARNLHRAAKSVMTDFAGVFPRTAETLRALPGVGPYTAGAVASIAFDVPAPLVDGNVQRVLSRLYGFEADPRTPKAQAVLWDTARAVVPAARPGDFNSALMELGATVCAPKNPQCLLCPVAAACVARERGIQDQIPPPKKAKPTPHFGREVYCLRRPDGTYLLEQRPAKGRWASLWQFVTIDPDTDKPPIAKAKARPLGQVAHALTHRRYTFDAFVAEVPKSWEPKTDRPTAWAKPVQFGQYPMPKPHVTVAQLLGEA